MKAPFSFLTPLLNLIMPPRCYMCGKLVGEKSALCPKCFAKVTFLSKQGCPVCGRPYVFGNESDIMCENCKRHLPKVKRLRAAFSYDTYSRELVLPFKHADRTDMTPFLGELMIKAGKDLIQNADVIIAVPLHRRRLIKRKYNQAALLAHYIAKKEQKKYLANTLLRIVNTKSQGHDNRKQRKENVKGAFGVKNPSRIKGKKVLIIDDVYTTGATLNECADTLYKNGAKRVEGLVLARVCRL